MERSGNCPCGCALGTALTGFGTTRDGTAVEAITIRGHGLSTTVLTYGAIIQDVRLDGIAHSLTVGSNMLADYEGDMRYFGCVVAPVANRLRDASAVIDGAHHTFEPNLDGQHTLHSGSNGAHVCVWDIDDVTEDAVTLSYQMPDGRGGFPGNRTISAQFEIGPGPTLRLTLTTTTDAPSIANATNHSYWNLDGSNTFKGHKIIIAADHYLPTNPVDTLVTGEIRAVKNTAFDFRTMTTMTPASPLLDHTFCVAHDRGALTDRLWLEGTSGVTMRVATTEAGVHVYDARDSGHCALAVEAQSWPDAPSNTEFPSIVVTPESPVVQITEWLFTKG
ncbi:Aldose 1-epimerase [Nymphon striatum]|nr:Aldose 1-epimerase [Nymphon striatum]